MIYLLNFDTLFCLRNSDPIIREQSLKLYIDSMTQIYLKPSPKKLLYSKIELKQRLGINFSIIDKTDTDMCIKKNVLYHY